MTQNKDLRTKVGYNVDQASVSAVQTANQKVAASFADAKAATAGWSADMLRLNPQLSAQTAQTTQAAAATNQLAASYKNAADGALRLARADNTIGSGFGTVRSLGSAVGQISGMGEAGGVVGAVAGLGVELGAVGVGLGVATLAFRALNEETKRITEATKRRLDVEEDLRRQLEEASRRDAEDRLAQAVEDRRLAQANLDNLRTSNRQIVTSQGEILQEALGIATGGIFGGGIRKGFEEQQRELEQIVIDSTAAIDYWNQVIEDNSTAVNTAAEAQRTYIDQTLEINQMTREERDKRVQEIGVEIGILKDFRAQEAEGSDLYVELTRRLEDLQAKMTNLITSSTTFADVLKAQQDAQKGFDDAFKNMGDAIADAGRAAEKLLDIREQMAEAEGEHTDKLREIADDAREREADARADAAKQAEDDLRKHNERLAEIERQFAIDRETAVGNRDALALYRAQQQRDEDVLKENTAFAEQQQALQEHLDEQLAQIIEAQREQEDSEKKSYDRRHRQLQRSLQDALNEQNRAASLALAYQRQAHEAQQRQQDAANTLRLMSQNFYQSAAANAAVTHQNTLISINNFGATAVEQRVMQMWQRIGSIGAGTGSLPGGIGGVFGSQSFNNAWDTRMLQFQQQVNR